MKASMLDFLGWRIYFGSPEMDLVTALQIRAALKKEMPGAKVIIKPGRRPRGLARVVPVADASAYQIARASSIATGAILRTLEANLPADGGP
jgi:hypothetical protein